MDAIDLPLWLYGCPGVGTKSTTGISWSFKDNQLRTYLKEEDCFGCRSPVCVCVCVRFQDTPFHFSCFSRSAILNISSPPLLSHRSKVTKVLLPLSSPLPRTAGRVQTSRYRSSFCILILSAPLFKPQHAKTEFAVIPVSVRVFFLLTWVCSHPLLRSLSSLLSCKLWFLFDLILLVSFVNMYAYRTQDML